MSDDKLLQITINVAGRPFQLKVKWEDESKYRDAAYEVNDKFELYSKKSNDPFDRLALIAFQQTFEKNNKLGGEDTPSSRSKISALSSLIDKELEEE